MAIFTCPWIWDSFFGPGLAAQLISTLLDLLAHKLEVRLAFENSDSNEKVSLLEVATDLHIRKLSRACNQHHYSSKNRWLLLAWNRVGPNLIHNLDACDHTSDLAFIHTSSEASFCPESWKRCSRKQWEADIVLRLSHDITWLRSVNKDCYHTQRDLPCETSDLRPNCDLHDGVS